MKARVKATGEIVEVAYHGLGIYVDMNQWDKEYQFDEIVVLDNGDPDYWTRLEHQYAGMAMQGIVKRAYNAYCDDCANYENMIFEDAQALLKDHAETLADVCVEFAHALVEKLKESK